MHFLDMGMQNFIALGMQCINIGNQTHVNTNRLDVWHQVFFVVLLNLNDIMTPNK